MYIPDRSPPVGRCWQDASAPRETGDATTGSPRSLAQLIQLARAHATRELIHKSTHQHPWPDASTVHAAIRKEFEKIKLADNFSPRLKLGTWNMQYLTQAKSKYFLATYCEIILRHHLLAVQEASDLAIISKACGYGHFLAMPNSRGQAVGFIVHPRLRVLECHQYSQMLHIEKTFDQRAALRLDLQDRASGLKFTAVTVHLKSMLGGLHLTSPIRFQQLQALLSEMCIDSQTVLILGDFNCFLDTASDTEPLIDCGFRMLNPHNHTSTHADGGRLDGAFYKNLPKVVKMSGYAIHDFWRNDQIGIGLSDHGLLSWNMLIANKNGA